MAEDASARLRGLGPPAAAAGLAVATALAFGRVFVGRGPTARLLAAALLAVAVGWATERRGLLLATLASAIGLLFALTWLVLPQTAWYGLPSIRTLRAMERCLAVVGQQTRTQVSPAPPFPPLLAAAVTAIWGASSSAHTLLARASSPMLALLPPAALVAFADLVLEDGVRPGYAALLVLAALGVALADGLRRIRRYGPLWTGRRTLARGGVGRGVRRVGLAGLLAALLVPSLLPGFRDEPLVDLASAGGGTVRLDPFVSIHASLSRDRPVPLFRVTTTEGGAYWRVVALDVFDGQTWRMGDPSLSRAVLYPSPARLPTQAPPSAPPFRQRFEILEDLGDRYLPMAHPPEAIDLEEGGSVRFDPDLGVAQAPDPLEAGDRYVVLSRRFVPTPEQLDAVRFEEPSAYGRATFLPADLPPEVAEIAREWTAGEPTPYRQVLAIERRLRGPGFTYSQDVRPVADSRAIVRFLTQTRTGFCQQFSTAMAVLVRALGYPARVAVGYRTGEPDRDGFVVSTDDAHSWVEVLFPGYGWLPFEPTPGRANPLATPGSYLLPEVPRGDADGGDAGAGATGGGIEALPGGLPPQIRNVEFLGGRRSGPVDLPPDLVAPAPEPGYGVPLGVLALGLLIALGATLVLLPLAKGLLRAASLRRRGPASARVLAAYRVFEGVAADVGLGRAPGETVLEHRERLARAAPSLDGHLDALAAWAVRAAYAPEPPSTAEAEAAARAAREAIRTLRREVGPARSLAGAYRPGR